MELANVKGWNYFLDIKINPRSANTFVSRGKEESSASLDSKCLNPHFLDQNFFPFHYYMPGRKYEGKMVSGE